MRGKVLSVASATEAGSIVGDDGQTYGYSAADIRSTPPTLGQRMAGQGASQDRDRSGWWCLLPVAPAVLAILFAIAGAATYGGTQSLYYGVAALLGLAYLATGLWIFIEFVRRGTIGPNRFGPDPST